MPVTMVIHRFSHLNRMWLPDTRFQGMTHFKAVHHIKNQASRQRFKPSFMAHIMLYAPNKYEWLLNMMMGRAMSIIFL